VAHNPQETLEPWFTAHPEALNVAIDIAGGNTVSDLRFHIVAVSNQSLRTCF